MKISPKSLLLTLKLISDIIKIGAIDIVAKKNLHTIIRGASQYWPTIFALVHDKPQDNIARIIRKFSVKSLRGIIKDKLHSKNWKMSVSYWFVLN